MNSIKLSRTNQTFNFEITTIYLACILQHFKIRPKYKKKCLQIIHIQKSFLYFKGSSFDKNVFCLSKIIF